MPAYAPSVAHPICDGLVPLGPRATSAEVATRLLELFTSGSVPLGTRLPPERKLAEVLAAGRSAVREALASLALLGVIETRPGAGTYLRSVSSGVVGGSMRWSLLMGERDVAELIEVRGALEIHAVRMAATRTPAATASALDPHLARMEATVDDVLAFIDADQAFHEELARASSNSVLAELLTVSHGLLRDHAPHRPDAIAQAHVALAEHRRIRDAIAAGDSDAAADEMAAAMRTTAALVADEVALV